MELTGSVAFGITLLLMAGVWAFVNWFEGPYDEEDASDMVWVAFEIRRSQCH